jgi:hypothetical protein
MNLLKKGFYFLLAATVLVACSDDDDAAPVGPIDPGNGGGDGHPLAGTSWSIAAEAGSLAVGPAADNLTWWSLTEEDVTTRACLLDDTYVFNADGTFSQDMQDSTWLEGWQEGQEGESCGTPIAPHNGSNDATWTANASTVTIVGDGAFLGLSKVHGAGQDGNAVDDTITYNYTLDSDRLTITITGWDAPANPDAVWQYILTKN